MVGMEKMLRQYTEVKLTSKHILGVSHVAISERCHNMILRTCYKSNVLNMD